MITDAAIEEVRLLSEHDAMMAAETDQSELREQLAAIQHEIWSHWMEYLFSVTVSDGDGARIPMDKAVRWHRQMRTDYADLTEKEKESDRDQADKVLAVIEGLT